MQPLSAPELLSVWESGLGQEPFERGLALLASATPSQKTEELAQLSVGQRDERLLTLREWTFGSQMACELHCPACGERLEMSIGVADIRVDGEAACHEPLSLKLDDYDLRFRLPDSRHLGPNEATLSAWAHSWGGHPGERTTERNDRGRAHCHC